MNRMKAASILLAFVVVLGFVSEAEAKEPLYRVECYTVSIGEYSFGFIESGMVVRPRWRSTTMCLGPLGSHEDPFTATQGLVGFCVILATLIIIPAVLTVRSKRKRAAA